MLFPILILFILAQKVQSKNITARWVASSRNRDDIAFIIRNTALEPCFSRFPGHDAYYNVAATCDDVEFLFACVLNTGSLAPSHAKEMVKTWVKNYSPPCSEPQLVSPFAQPKYSIPIKRPIERPTILASAPATPYEVPRWIDGIRYTSDEVTILNIAAHFTHLMMSALLIIRILKFVWSIITRFHRYLTNHRFNREKFFSRRYPRPVTIPSPPPDGTNHTLINMSESNPFSSIPPPYQVNFAAHGLSSFT